MAQKSVAEPWEKPEAPENYIQRIAVESNGVRAVAVFLEKCYADVETSKTTSCTDMLCLGKQNAVAFCDSEIPVFCDPGARIELEKDCVIFAGPGCIVNTGKNREITKMSPEDELEKFEIPKEILHLSFYDDSLVMSVRFEAGSTVYAAGNSRIRAKSSCQIILSSKANVIESK